MKISPPKRIISEIDPKYDNKDWRKKRLRVCGYIRVSTDKSDQANSLKHQRARCEREIPLHPNWEYVGCFADDGISGTSIRNRDGFRKMLESCKAGEIDLIVVKEVSRFARNVKDCLNTAEELLTLDPPVGIYFENNNLNTLEVGSKMFLTILAMLAELESELKSRSVESGLEEIYRAGNYPGPSKNLLGYIKDGKYGMSIDPEGAKTVRLIYDLFIAGYSQQEIANALTRLSLLTVKGNPWSPNAVTGILRNEKFCGDFLMRKSYTVSFLTHQSRRNIGQRRHFYDTDHHDAIVSREEHAKALLLLKANHASPFFNHEYEIKVIRQGLFSGFIPMNCAFGGYDAGHYLGAFVMARIPPVNVTTMVTHIEGAKRVRRELYGDRYAAVVTISSVGIAFTSGCVSLLKDTAYVEILLHPHERLLAVRKTSKSNKNAIPWNNNGVSAKELSSLLYEMMGWQNNWKHKVTANFFTKNGEQAIIFDLNCCESRFRDKENENKLTRAVPHEWLSEFGIMLPEYMMLCRRAFADRLDDWDIGASASAVEGFINDINALSRRDAEKMIQEMGLNNGQR